ncbi:hypothetical protein F4680DRAFT_179772 [Xylaria scruposa]|nr:hypothetical protein F4680DRAFT_179772 [Xylaria scruposa]
MSIWHSRSKPQFLWHTGPPRSGKTKMSWQLVQDYLNKSSASRLRMACFFHPDNNNSIDSTGSLTSNEIVRSIIAQLINNSDDVMQSIPPDHQQKLLTHCQSPQLDQEVIFWDTIKILMRVMAESEILPIIIIDGADRLPPKQRIRFLQNIRDFWINTKESRLELKILISSRPYPDIEKIIGDLPSISPEKECTECLKYLLSHAQNKRRTTITPGDPQTCDWLWSDDSYEHWNDSPNSTLLWIQGKPGSGKSTLSKKILNKLLTEHNVTLEELYNAMDPAYSFDRKLPTERYEQTPPRSITLETKKRVIVATFFYSVRGAMTEVSHVQMLHSLLYQILWQERRFYTLFREKHHELRQIKSSKWTFDDLRKVLTALAEFDGFPITIYLLIDGLDESERTGERDKMLLLLSDLHSKTSQCLVKSVLLRHTYCDDRSDGEEGNEGVLEYTKKYLIDNAQGVFLWVELVSHELTDLFEMGITMTDLQGTLTRLPNDLELFYQLIIKRLAIKKDTDEARRMVIWTTFALRPLTVDEFRDAIAIPASTDKHLSIDIKQRRFRTTRDVQLRLQSNCGGLLEIKSKDSEVRAQDTVQLLHRTVRDFLLRPDKAADPFDMEESRESCVIAWICVRYLRMSMENIVIAPELDYLSFVENISSWTLLPYIIRFLPQHLVNTRTHLWDARKFAANFVEDMKRKTGHPALSLLETWLRDMGLLDGNYIGHEAAAAFRTKCLDIAAASGNLNATMVVLYAAGSTELGGGLSSALYNAAINGHASVVRLLLNNGADGDAKVRDSDGNVLQAAVLSGNIEIAELLLMYGADPNVRGRDHNTALHMALSHGNFEIIKALLSYGADPNIEGKDHNTPLHIALSRGNFEIIELLLSYEADPKITGKDHNTVLHIASSSGNIEIVDLLLSFMADSNIEAEKGNAALQEA